MRRLVFPLMALGALLITFMLAMVVFPATRVPLSVPWLMVWVVWAIGVVPVFFYYWSRYDERRELQLVDEALAACRAHAPDAMAKVAQALLTVVDHEDAPRLKQVLEVLGPELAATHPAARDFQAHASAWLELTAKGPAAAGSMTVLERYDQLEDAAQRLATSLAGPRA